MLSLRAHALVSAGETAVAAAAVPTGQRPDGEPRDSASGLEA